MQIIILDRDMVKGSLLANELIEKFKYQVVCKDDVEEAINFLDMLGEVGLVIAKDIINKDRAAEKMANHIEQNKLGVDLIVLGDNIDSTGNNVKVFPRSIHPTKLIEELAADGTLKDEGKANEYVPVPFNIFEYLPQSVCDVFLKMSKDGGEKFIKVFNKGDAVESSDMMKYEKKGVSHFFVGAKDWPNFSKMVTGRLAELMKDDKVLSDQKGDLGGDMHQNIFGILTNVGISPESLELAQETAEKMMDNMKSDKKLNSLLQSVYKSEGDYSYRHSYMTGITSVCILDEMSWADDRMKEHVLVASFMNDMVLKSQEEIEFRTDEELEARDDIKRNEKLRITTHAAASADKLSKINNIPQEVVNLVRQHHGNANGESFKNSLATQITRVSYVFMLSEEFTVFVLKSGSSKIDIPKFIEEVSARHQGGDFLKALDAFKAIIGQ